MSEIKVRLSFEVPGATMLSSQECEENPKENYNHYKLMVETPPKKKWQKPHREFLNIRTRKTRPAKQSISISKEAYDHMTSLGGKPNQNYVGQLKLTQAVWAGMSPEQRLDIHMALIVESFGGSNYQYEVLAD